MAYKLHFRYVYTYYRFDEIVDDAAIDESFEISTGTRFKLHQQEDSAFHVSGIGSDRIGKYAILTFPGKDSLVVHEGEECELAYDEFFEVMGEGCHNVYEGTVTLVCE